MTNEKMKNTITEKEIIKAFAVFYSYLYPNRPPLKLKDEQNAKSDNAKAKAI